MSPDVASPAAALVSWLLRLLFYGSLAAGSYLAFTPSLPDMAVFRVSDMVLHASGFAYLTFTLTLAHPALEPARAVFWMSGYGVLVEIVQFFVPERAAEGMDLVMDAAGIIVGLLVASKSAGRLRQRLVTFTERVWPA